MRKATTAYLTKFDSTRLHGMESPLHKVEVTRGSKYYTITSPDRFKGMRFSIEDPWKDGNGNNGHLEHTDYSPKYILYEDVYHAIAYRDREVCLHEIRGTNFDKLDLKVLRSIVATICSSKRKERQ